MTTFSNDSTPKRAAVCIKEMAAQVGLSRQRFMQLVKVGVFPQPLRDEATGRPYFTDELQAQCLEVRRRNCGINNKVVMFYSRRAASVTQPSRLKQVKPTKPKPTTTSSEGHAEIVAGLHGLGLVAVTASQVADAVVHLFPNGTAGADHGNVLRAIFLHLRGKNSAEKVGRKE